MEIILYDKQKIVVTRTKTGASISLWRTGYFSDGHGHAEVSGALLSEEEVAALIATLQPPPPPAVADAA